MEKGRFLLLMMICCSIPQLHAQWDAPLSRYWTVKGHYNPAFAGSSEMIDFSLLYRYQWAGIRYAPQRAILNAHMPIDFLGRRHGAGVTAYSTTAGNLRNSLLAAQYSYILPTRHGNLHFGLHAGIHDLAFDEGSSRISGNDNQSTQPSYIVEGVKRQLPDLGAGIAWQGDNCYAGLSLLHLNQPSFQAQNDTLDLQSDSLKSIIPRNIHFMAGYNIRLSHSFAIEPMVWVQAGNGNTQLQTTLRAVVADRYSGGLFWRSGDGYGFFFGTTLEGIEFEYGYDHHTGGMGKLSRGSHELTLRYRFATERWSSKRQPQKSIRLL